MIKSRRLRWACHVARMEDDRSAFKILTGTPTGKRPLRIHLVEEIKTQAQKAARIAGCLNDLVWRNIYEKENKIIKNI